MNKKSGPTPKNAVKPPSKPVKHSKLTRTAASEVVPAVDEARLLSDLRGLIHAARQRVATIANSTHAMVCWHVGKRLLKENLQEGRAAYRKQILVTVSRELTVEFGDGFSYSSLTRMVRFSELMTDEAIVVTLSQQLSWSHFLALIPIKDPLARDFCAEMCRIERWDVRTLRKKIGGMLFEGTALSKNTAEVISAEIANLRDDPKRCGKANCLSSPHRGSNKSAQGKATRPKPQSAALGSDPQAEQALKGRNNEPALIGTIRGAIASRLCRPFRARRSVVRGPRAALRGEGRYALPWADLWWPFRPVDSDADRILKMIGGLSK